MQINYLHGISVFHVSSKQSILFTQNHLGHNCVDMKCAKLCLAKRTVVRNQIARKQTGGHEDYLRKKVSKLAL